MKCISANCFTNRYLNKIKAMLSVSFSLDTFVQLQYMKYGLMVASV